MSGNIKGFTDSKRQGEQVYATLSPIPGNKVGLDVIAKAAAEVNTVAVTVTGLNSGDDLRQVIQLTGHGAQVGWQVRFNTGNNTNIDYVITEIIDANNFKLGAILDADPQIGDEVFFYAPRSINMNSSGALSISNGPIQINKDAAVVEITKDTGTPANTIALPVEIVSGSGTEINITAGDINIQSTHLGVSFDSMRIGDGTNLLAFVDETITGSQFGIASYGFDGTNYRRLLTDAAGNLQIDIVSSALPTGAATEATLSSLDGKDFATQTTLAALNGKVTACDTGAVTIASSALPTGAATEATLSSLNGKVTACDTGAVVISSSALPTGAATEATLAALSAKVTACDTGAVVISSSALPTGAATEATLSTLNGKVTACDTGNVTIASSALPTGAATETTLAALSAKFNSLGQKTAAASAPVVLASDQPAIPTTQSALNIVAFATLDFSSSNVTDSAYTELLASIGGTEGKKIQIFMSSGDPMYLATGAAASETDRLIIPPGGVDAGFLEVNIGVASRLSLKRVVAGTTSSGRIIINVMG